MKFVRFKDSYNYEKLGVLTTDELEVLEIAPVLKKSNFKSMIDIVRDITKDELAELSDVLKENRRGLNVSEGECYKLLPGSELEKRPKYIYHNVSEVKICSPIKKPIHDIICVGLNYKDHLEETKESFKGDLKEPSKIVYFSKRAYEIIGHGGAVESRMDLDTELDYEVELAVIIGKTGKNIAKEDVENYIFGYSIFNDISSRSLQKSHVQWFRGKSLDTYSAMGPCIVHKNALPFPIELDLKSYVNGELRQSSNTRLFLADIPRIISEISTGITLEPGDIIVTGTPSGVGMGMKPVCYMKKGDVVVCEIEKIGKLENIIE